MYRIPHSRKEVFNEEVEEMLKNNIIKRSKILWNFSLLGVPKKSGPEGEKKWRVVVGFR